MWLFVLLMKIIKENKLINKKRKTTFTTLLLTVFLLKICIKLQQEGLYFDIEPIKIIRKPQHELMLTSYE